ncbi:MAG: DUF2085 domain-containing protein [Rhodothermia bacterium]
MQTMVTRYSGIVWVVTAAAALVALTGAVLGPRPAFALLCHQIPGRSFTINGHLFAVCHRCTGLYLGLFLGLIGGMIPAVKTFVDTWGLRLIAVAAVIVVADVVLDAANILYNTPLSRVVTGLGLGLAAGLFLTSIILNTQTANS